MAGTLHGVVNKRIPRVADNSYNNSAHYLAAVAQFFNHLCTPAGGSYMTRVASNWGGGSGWDYVGGSTPIGTSYHNKALGVWKLNTSTLRPGGGSALGEVYFFLVASIGNSTGARFDEWSLYNAADIYGYGEVGIQVAFNEDGSNPWAGDSDDDGTDLPRTTGGPWDPGTSTCHVVIPRSCNSGGSHATNRDNMAALCDPDFYDFEINHAYFHGIADADNVAFLYTSSYGLETSDDPRDMGMFFFGLGELQPNCGSDPYFCWAFTDAQLGLSRGATYGDNAGSQLDYNGGAKQPRSSVSQLQFSLWHAGMDQNRSPNPYSSTGLIREEQGFQLYNYYSWLGYGHEPSGNDFIRFVYGVPHESYDPVNKRAAFGNLSLLSEKCTLPWPDSIGEVPGATRTDDGVYF